MWLAVRPFHSLTSYLALLESPAAPLRRVLAALVALVSFQARLVWLSSALAALGLWGFCKRDGPCGQMEE